jgi:hypothetical protein
MGCQLEHHVIVEAWPVSLRLAGRLVRRWR